MRVAIIAVAIALVSSPAMASPSCMTQGEARAKFPKEHLWWHGPNRCWNATPPSRQRLAERNKTREAKQAARDAEAERELAPERKPSRSANDSKWREAMSRARPEDLVGTGGMTASAQAEVNFAPSEAPAASRMNWRERWVEIAQRVPPVVDQAGPGDLAADARVAEPIVTPTRVMLALLVLLLGFGAFELIVRRPTRDRRAD